MYLINVDKLITTNKIHLEDFSNKRVKPPYAILSHRWFEHEVSFQNVYDGVLDSSLQPSLTKIGGAARQAAQNDLHYLWVDTCCIDKKSSSELSEAINSMFKWYKNSKCCYAYLHDVQVNDDNSSMDKSEWFRRGWTLQELLAPSDVYFFDRTWQDLGSRNGLSSHISKLAKIHQTALTGGRFNGFSIAQKMSWAADRETTRIEDMAYCLMGIFDVNMPLLYGEGEKAFQRLQEQIIMEDNSHSIFAWNISNDNDGSGLFAPHPNSFRDCGGIVDFPSGPESFPFSATNFGISLSLEMTPWEPGIYLAFLECGTPIGPYMRPVGIYLQRIRSTTQYVRIKINNESIWIGDDYHGRVKHSHILQRNQIVVQKAIHKRLAASEAWVSTAYTRRNQIYGFAWEDTEQYFIDWDRTYGTVKAAPDGGHLLTLEPGQAGVPVLSIESVSETWPLKWLMLGFDFEFNPFVVVGISSADRNHWLRDHEWSTICSRNFKWDFTYQAKKFQPERHPSVWTLRGHRLSEASACVHDIGGHYLSNIGFKQKTVEGKWIWRLIVGD